MAEYQFVVDRVRGFVTGADQTRTDALADLATNFADLCQEANIRLRRCLDYLRRGLRSEAIHLAESHPNLLDMVAALDIPEIDEWEQLCAVYELSRPARMMIEAAQELNEAYAQEKPLQHLLTRHRVLALRRAPLAERLEVIRELGIEDPTNSCWAEDQQSFEQARLRELRLDVANAVRSKNLNIIDGLSSEILGQKWRVEVPTDIKDTLSKASWSLHADDALAQLRAMVPEIDSTFQLGSYPDAKQLLVKWEKIVSDYKVALPQDLKAESARLRKWVTDHEQLQVLHASFQDLCANLRSVMDVNVPQETLNAQYSALKALGLPIPDDLEQDYRRRKRKVEQTQKFEQIGIYGLAVIVAIVILGAVALVIWQHFQSGAH